MLSTVQQNAHFDQFWSMKLAHRSKSVSSHCREHRDGQPFFKDLKFGAPHVRELEHGMKNVCLDPCLVTRDLRGAVVFIPPKQRNSICRVRIFEAVIRFHNSQLTIPSGSGRLAASRGNERARQGRRVGHTTRAGRLCRRCALQISEHAVQNHTKISTVFRTCPA